MPGIASQYGFGLPDNNYVNGIAQGLNATVQNGVTAKAGGTQAAGTPIKVTAQLVSVDTCASSGDSVVLPVAQPGMQKMIFNNTATSSLYVYGANSTDTINGTVGSTAYQIATFVAVLFSCPKAGVWTAIKSA